jgi:hypothetical protein
LFELLLSAYMLRQRALVSSRAVYGTGKHKLSPPQLLCISTLYSVELWARVAPSEQWFTGLYSHYELSGISAKEKAWFLGSLVGRGGFQAWMTHLTKGLQDASFLLQFEGTSDPWERSRLVGKKISELRRTYAAMNDDERTELAKQAEIEMKTGLELLGRDKKTIQELIALVDPPATTT